MDNTRTGSSPVSRRAFLGAAAASAIASVCGPPRALAKDVPDAFDGKRFQLRAPEPNAKRGGVLRYGVITAPAHFDVHQQGATILTQGCMYDNLIRRDPRDS